MITDANNMRNNILHPEETTPLKEIELTRYNQHYYILLCNTTFCFTIHHSWYITEGKDHSVDYINKIVKYIFCGVNQNVQGCMAWIMCLCKNRNEPVDYEMVCFLRERSI